MRKSWIDVAPMSHFPIQNIPFGIYSTDLKTTRPGVAIGNNIIDLKSLAALGLLGNLPFTEQDFDSCVLNTLMRHGKSAMVQLRSTIMDLLDEKNPTLK